MFFDEPELYGCALKAILTAEFPLHVAFVAPVEELGAGAKDFEGGCRVVVFLDDVIELGVAVLESGRRVFVDDFAKPAVERHGLEPCFPLGHDIKQ